MEIARRASKPLEFDFTDVDNDRAFFALKRDLRAGPMRDKLDIGHLPDPRSRVRLRRQPPENHRANPIRRTSRSFSGRYSPRSTPIWAGWAVGACRFDFELIYLNSSSAKAVMMLMDKLDAAAKKGATVDVYWYL